jgi:hypothetical protein
MLRTIIPVLLAFLGVFLSACASGGSGRSTRGSSAVAATTKGFEPTFAGEWAGDAICYGPYRDGQAPGSGPQPTKEQVAEDVRIMAQYWRFVRMYGIGDATEYFLQTARDEKLPVKLFMGIWIAPEAELDKDGNVVRVLEQNVIENQKQVEGAIRLARTYPEQIAAIGVGNETQVYCSSTFVLSAVRTCLTRSQRVTATSSGSRLRVSASQQRSTLQLCTFMQCGTSSSLKMRLVGRERSLRKCKRSIPTSSL